MSIVKPLKIEPCVYCDNIRPLVQQNPENRKYVVACPRCGARGPEDVNQENCKARWNKSFYRKVALKSIQCSLEYV